MKCRLTPVSIGITLRAMPRETNRGAIALRRAMRRHKPPMTQGAVRRAVGAPAGTITRWLSGDRKPNRDNASKLFKMFGIKIEWWSETVVVDDDDEGPETALTGT